MLVYRKKIMSLDEFSRMLDYLLSVNIIAVDFNFHLSKVSSSKLLDHMKRYANYIWIPNKSYQYKKCFARGVLCKGHYLKHILF